MDIPSSGMGLLRPLFKPIIDFFGMLLFYRAYEISTLYHNHREVFSMPPEEIVDGIEFDIIWKPYHLRKKLVTPMIWLRAKDGKVFSKIELVVTASNSKIRYQDHISLFDINEIPVQTALPSVPFRSLKFEGNMVFTPYDDIKISVRELYDGQNSKVGLRHSSEARVRPFDNLEVAMGLAKGDVEKWGEVFNLEFIEMELREEKIRLIGGKKLGGLKLLYYIRRRVFSIGLVVKIVFWSKNIIFAKQLTSELTRYLEMHERISQAV